MPTATSSPVTAPRRFTIGFSEILNFAYDAFSSNKLQFILTSLAMAVGTASVILVVTIGLTGKQYILRQIQSIGANMIYADYQGGSQRIDSTPDPMTVEDVDAPIRMRRFARQGRAATSEQGQLPGSPVAPRYEEPPTDPPSAEQRRTT